MLLFGNSAFSFSFALKLFLALVFALFFHSEHQNESEEEPETVWLFAFQEVLEACFQKRMGCKNGFMKSNCGVEKSQFL